MFLKTKQVRNRILFTLLMVGIFVLGTYIPLPYVRSGQATSPLGNLMSLVSGGALSRFGLLALGITPTINASIIVQIFIHVIPVLKKWQEEGEIGSRKISQTTRILSLFFAIIMGFSLLFIPVQANMLGVTIEATVRQKCLLLIVLVSGSLFTTFLGEQIDANGFGQGASVLMTFGILSRVPAQVTQVIQIRETYQTAEKMDIYNRSVLILLATFIFITVSCILANKKTFAYPIQAKGNRYRVKAHHFDLKLLASSVMPVIFANMFLVIFQVIGNLLLTKSIITENSFALQLASYQTIPGLILFAATVYLVSFLYGSFQLDEKSVQDHFNQGGVYFIGTRETKTAKFLTKKFIKTTLVGAPVLTIIATASMVVDFFIPKDFNLAMSGMSLLIVVGVLQEIAFQIKGLTEKNDYKAIL